MLFVTACEKRDIDEGDTEQTPPVQAQTLAPTPPGLDETIVEQVPLHDYQLVNNRWTHVKVGEVDYELCLIPGDADQQIKPFYIGKTEVTWDMFYEWSYGQDLDSRELSEAIKKDLRPSPLFESVPNVMMGLGKRPAVGMSWRTAQAYCDWLSEKTGHTYRLPTDREWVHVLTLSGGIPKARDVLLKQALLGDNAFELDQPPFLFVTNEIASKAPNALGLYDLLGNAAEWVQPVGDKRWVRGGHFQLPADELTADWRAFEDQSVWNETYPQLPVSRFWYIDHYYQGLRLVREIDAPEKENARSENN